MNKPIQVKPLRPMLYDGCFIIYSLGSSTSNLNLHGRMRGISDRDFFPFFVGKPTPKIRYEKGGIKISICDGVSVRFVKAVGSGEFYGPRLYLTLSPIVATNLYLEDGKRFSALFDCELDIKLNKVGRQQLVSTLRAGKKNFPLTRTVEYAQLQYQVMKAISAYCMRIYQFGLATMFKMKIPEEAIRVGFGEAEFCLDRLVNRERYFPGLVEQLFREHRVYGLNEKDKSMGPDYPIMISSPVKSVETKVYPCAYSLKKVSVRSEVVLTDVAIKRYFGGNVRALSVKRLRQFRRKVSNDYRPRIISAWKAVRDVKPYKVGGLLRRLLALIGRTDMAVFTEVFTSLVNTGMVTRTYTKTFGVSGARTGTSKPNTSLIDKMKRKGVVQRLDGKKGVYGITNKWRGIKDNVVLQKHFLHRRKP